MIKLNHSINQLFFHLFVFCDGYLIQKLPIWYNVGVFLIIYFFTNKISKYSFIGLKEEHSTQVILFDFLTLFGILISLKMFSCLPEELQAPGLYQLMFINKVLQYLTLEWDPQFQ